jgi:hypothetical protein
MAEIKSTLELAMERTKKMAISQEEREEIKRREIVQKANSLFHRSLEGHLPLNEIQREIERMDEKTRAMVKEILLSQWINSLSLKGENEKLLEMIESLKSRGIDEAKQKLFQLISQYRREKGKAEQEKKAQRIEALRKEGIDGSAVDLDIEEDTEWKEWLEARDQPFKGKMEEVKEILRRL